jgi:hypothetical protein
MTRTYGSTTLSFLRNFNPQKDCTADKDRKSGRVYIHRWATGYQLLVFDDDKEAGQWWEKEMERLTLKKNHQPTQTVLL